MAHALDSLFPIVLAALGSQLAADSEAAMSSATYHDTVEADGDDEGAQDDFCRGARLDLFNVSPCPLSLCALVKSYVLQEHFTRRLLGLADLAAFTCLPLSRIAESTPWASDMIDLDPVSSIQIVGRNVSNTQLPPVRLFLALCAPNGIQDCAPVFTSLRGHAGPTASQTQTYPVSESSLQIGDNVATVLLRYIASRPAVYPAEAEGTHVGFDVIWNKRYCIYKPHMTYFTIRDLFFSAAESGALLELSTALRIAPPQAAHGPLLSARYLM